MQIYNFDRTEAPLLRIVGSTLMVMYIAFQAVTLEDTVSSMSHIGSMVLGCVPTIDKMKHCMHALVPNLSESSKVWQRDDGFVQINLGTHNNHDATCALHVFK